MDTVEGKPMVTILIPASHEALLKPVLESVNAQQVNFDFEVIILFRSDKDLTRQEADRITNGAKNKTRLVCVRNERDMYSHISVSDSKYVALLDQNDRWCDTCKLQKQVDILESRPDLSFTAHLWIEYYRDLKVYKNPFEGFAYAAGGMEIDTDFYFRNRCVHFSAMLFRRSALDRRGLEKYKLPGIDHLSTELMKTGGGYLQPFTGTVRYISREELRKSRGKFWWYHRDFQQLMELWKANPGISALQRKVESAIEGMSLRNLNASDIKQEWDLVAALIRYATNKMTRPE